MKPILNYQLKEIVDVWDEVNLWSAPFARLMLDNIPMKPRAKVLDIGFGTGFPLIELSQRFGSTSRIYGMDIWPEAIKRTRIKIQVFELGNVEIFEQSAEQIPLPNNYLDLICSNLGVNNFDNKEKVISECHRVLHSDGALCITTNPIGTFRELFDIFQDVLTDEKLYDILEGFQKYLDHRGSLEIIKAEFENAHFKLSKELSDKSKIRFTNAEAVFDHSLIRIGFMESWNKIIPTEKRDWFFREIIKRIEHQITKNGEFVISFPVLYLEFSKNEI